MHWTGIACCAILVQRRWPCHRCDGLATIYKGKQNSFNSFDPAPVSLPASDLYAHVLKHIVLPSFPFLSTAVKFIFYVLIGAKTK